jgi:hypothetical protein
LKYSQQVNHSRRLVGWFTSGTQDNKLSQVEYQRANEMYMYYLLGSVITGQWQEARHTAVDHKFHNPANTELKVE